MHQDIEKAPRQRILTIRKGPHRHHFRYKEGQELDLLYFLMESSQMKNSEITVRDIICTIAYIMKKSEEDFDVVIEESVGESQGQ